jgi:hypothetical protein
VPKTLTQSVLPPRCSDTVGNQESWRWPRNPLRQVTKTSATSALTTVHQLAAQCGDIAVKRREGAVYFRLSISASRLKALREVVENNQPF